MKKLIFRYLFLNTYFNDTNYRIKCSLFIFKIQKKDYNFRKFHGVYWATLIQKGQILLTKYKNKIYKFNNFEYLAKACCVLKFCPAKIVLIFRIYKYR